jgi:hypothetical protein
VTYSCPEGGRITAYVVEAAEDKYAGSFSATGGNGLFRSGYVTGGRPGYARG